MASITVSSSGYWGDNAILSSGTWAGLLRGDTITVQGGAVLTADPSVRTPTGILVGAKITATAGYSKIRFVNTSTSAALIHLGPGGNSSKLTIQNDCTFEVAGDYIQIGTGNGSAGQTISGYTTAGYDVKDEPSHVEVETGNGTGVYEIWLNVGAQALTDIGQGVLGKWFSYNNTTGVLTFGNNGNPQLLTANASAGQAVISVADASGFTTSDYLQVIDSNGRESYAIKIQSKTGNDITLVSNLDRSYTTASGAFARLSTGGSVIPNGARVRAYNVGIGSIDAGGARVFSTNSSNATTGDYQFDPGKGNFIIDKGYAFGFYPYLRLANSVSISNFGTVQPTYFHTIVNISLSKIVRTCAGKYDTNNLHGIYIGAGPLIGGSLNNCYGVGANGHGIWLTGTTVTVDGGFYATIKRNASSLKAVNVFASDSIVKNCTISGHIQIGSPNVSMLDNYHTDTLNGITESTYAYASVYSSPGLVGIDVIGLYSIPDGSQVYRQYLVRGSFRRIIKLDYGFFEYNTTSSAFSTEVALNTVLSDIKIDRSSYGYSPIGSFSLSGTLQKFFPRYAAVNLYVVSNNTIMRQVDMTDSSVSSSSSSGPSGLNSHFYEARTISNKTSGFMGVWFCPKSDDYQYLVFSGNVKCISSSIQILSAGGCADFIWPHRIKGVTSFPSGGSINTGGTNSGNFTLQYQIDLGGGYNGTWLTLNHTNLSTHTLDPVNGFGFKVRVSHASGSLTDTLSRLNWTTNVDYDTAANLYPDYEVTVTLQNIKDGSAYYVYNETTNKVIAQGVQSGTSDIVIAQVPYNGSNETLLVRVRKSSASPKYLPFETHATLTANGAGAWVEQTLDRVIA